MCEGLVFRVTAYTAAILCMCMRLVFRVTAYTAAILCMCEGLVFHVTAYIAAILYSGAPRYGQHKTGRYLVPAGRKSNFAA